MTVAVDIPDDLERGLREGWPDVPRSVLEAVALEAHRSGAEKILQKPDAFIYPIEYLKTSR